jgi:bifunctional UDP-N-acetylglucosamine pyrophosphorylase/glucosamine-1-phosphate N-acetyltransferase
VRFGGQFAAPAATIGDGVTTIDNDTSDGEHPPQPPHKSSPRTGTTTTSSELTPLDGWAAVIFAAGRGTRMRSTLPKVLHPVAGRPMLDLIRNSLQAAGFTQIVVVTPDADGPVAQAALNGGAPGTQIAVQAEPLGTADAALAARPLVEDASKLIFLNSDLPLFRPQTLRNIAERHENSAEPLTFLTALLVDPVGFGRVQRRDGRLQAVVEDLEADTAARGAVEVNAGVYAFDADWLWPALDGLPPGKVTGERYLTSVIERAVADGGAQTYQIQESSELQHVSTREDLAEAERIMRQRVRDELMAQGVTLLDPATTYIDAGVEVAADTVIEPGVHLRGATTIGANCQIGPNAILRDMQVGSGCVIGSSTLEGSILADDVTIGPYCHIRPGSTVEANVRLGNYVELKASRLGSGTRVGHFSYIGDADVGADVNVGAGTVTVNYDGKEKHETHIGDGAFIGSDSMLIAPIEIGERARTAAGSVVTHDVPADGAVRGVPAQPDDEARRGDEGA